jgi:RND superfamily putative drug exporter
MVRWTRFVIAHRKRILAAWVGIVVLAGVAASGLGDLLTSRFTIPGAEAEKGFNLLTDEFKAQGDGFTLVVKPRAGTDSSKVLVSAQTAADRGAKAAKGNASPLQPAGSKAYFSQLTTPLEFSDAADITPKVRKAIGKVPGVDTYLTGGAAIQYDTDPIFAEDLAKGEMIALPIALFVLAFMLGTLGAMFLPILFAFVTIPTTLGIVWIFAHLLDMPQEVTNIVTLIGLAIAIDYSMLIVFRYREELRKCDFRCDIALVETMRTAGHATVFSGLTVALGLGLLILMPLPFMQAMGIGGLLVPLVSIAACLTFLPALLSVMDKKINRFRIVPKRVLERRHNVGEGMWARLARSIIRRPVPYLLVAGALMLGLIYPATEINLTGGDNRGIPKTTEATKGLAILESSLGPGTLAPNEIVVDTGGPGGAYTAKALAQQQEIAALLGGDDEISTVESPAPILGKPGKPSRATFAELRKANLVDPSGRYWQVQAAGRQDGGTQAAKDLVHRIRDDYLPATGIERANKAYVTGAPAFGVDFIDVAYGAFPFLVGAVLILTYILLLRAFRSLFLPLKAVLMNVLSVAATFGVLVLAFQHHWGKIAGWDATPQIEAWIPIFLFAILFGLSMDYEVFLLSRMREEWDKTKNNDLAIISGLQHTGRIITAAAVIMIAAFAGFTAGSFVGLQEFGLGLSAAVLLDATIVRSVLVPSTMKLIGDWNWYLPPKVARLMRVPVEVPAIPEAEPAAARAPSPAAADLLTIERERRGDAIRLRLSGELDLATKHRLAAELSEVEAEAPELLVIDLGGVDYMDSTGLAELIGAARRARQRGRRIVLLRGREPVEQILELAGLDGVFERAPDAEAAGFN